MSYENQAKTSGAGECAPKRERFIPNQTGRLESLIDELEGAFEDLQGRLLTVRSEEATGKTLQEIKQAGLPCPLAEFLRGQNERIQNIVSRIRYQLEVLEV